MSRCIGAQRGFTAREDISNRISVESATNNSWGDARSNSSKLSNHPGVNEELESLAKEMIAQPPEVVRVTVWMTTTMLSSGTHQKSGFGPFGCRTSTKIVLRISMNVVFLEKVFFWHPIGNQSVVATVIQVVR